MHTSCVHQGMTGGIVGAIWACMALWCSWITSYVLAVLMDRCTLRADAHDVHLLKTLATLGIPWSPLGTGAP